MAIVIVLDLSLPNELWHTLETLLSQVRRVIEWSCLVIKPLEGVLGSIFAGYVLLASQSPYPIIVYSVANYRPHLRQICNFSQSQLSHFVCTLYWVKKYFYFSVQTFSTGLMGNKEVPPPWNQTHHVLTNLNVAVPDTTVILQHSYNWITFGNSICLLRWSLKSIKHWRV